jgi:hypothetical protein
MKSWHEFNFKENVMQRQGDRLFEVSEFTVPRDIYLGTQIGIPVIKLMPNSPSLFKVQGEYLIEFPRIYFDYAVPVNDSDTFHNYSVKRNIQIAPIKCQCGLGDNTPSRKHYSYCPLYRDEPLV